MRSVKNGMFVSSNHELREDSREQELIGNFDGFTNFSYMDFDGCCSRKHPFIDNKEFWLNLINGSQISNSSGVDVH